MRWKYPGGRIRLDLIEKGAEANLYLGSFEDELFPSEVEKVLIKRRISKSYRVRELDQRLRSSRTSLEAKLLSDAKSSGVTTPLIYKVDTEKMELVMDYVEGRTVKEVLEGLEDSDRDELCETLGRFVARLHDFGIIHGDLTTSNMIVTDGGKIYFIDFGLGEYNSSLEARGTDLHLLHRTLESTHFRVSEEAYRAILRGYREEFGEGAEEVISRVEEIEVRGRYVAKEDRK